MVVDVTVIKMAAEDEKGNDIDYHVDENEDGDGLGIPSICML
jgi:hypothetical protein